MSILKKLTAISLGLLLLYGVSFADTNDQSQVSANNENVVKQAANIDNKADKSNLRTSREFISPLRKNRLERRHDRRVSMLGQNKDDAPNKN